MFKISLMNTERMTPSLEAPARAPELERLELEREVPANLPDGALVDRALLSESLKAAVKRALARRPDFGRLASPRPSPAEVDSFEVTDFVMHLGGSESRVVISRGKPLGLLRRRSLTYWIFVAEKEGSHFFPVCSHASVADAAAMLTIIFAEFAGPR
jgi:hypothetical protein